MGKFPVRPETELELLQRMQQLGIRESDLTEKFIVGSGSGGQKRNKSSSTVQLTHEPSGIIVRASRERSQALNRFFARRELCDRLAGTKRDDQIATKIRKAKQRRSRRHRTRRTQVENKT